MLIVLRKLELDGWVVLLLLRELGFRYFLKRCFSFLFFFIFFVYVVASSSPFIVSIIYILL